MLIAPALRLSALAGACLVVLGVAGATPAGAATPGGSNGADVTAEGSLAAAASGSGAVTYNPELAPTGAHLSATFSPDDSGGTRVALDVEGLRPSRGYAAHAHVKPCGPTPADAGPHFQDKADPAAGPDKPSTDPAYANPENEVWLDFHTDQDGAGHAETDVPFRFVENRSPRSIVIHEGGATMTDMGHAGTAGGRAACLTLPTS